MRAPLTVAAAQPACTPYDVAVNAEAHAAVIRSAASRLVVFPELSLTGYQLDAPTVDPDDVRLAPVVRACADAGSVALLGAPVVGLPDGAAASAAEPGPNLAMLAVDGSGVRVVYRKLWLGSEEAERFVPGREPAVLDVDGWRLGLAICKDTGVPQHVDDTVALGVDAYVAGTLMSVHETSIQDDRARGTATRHRVWVVVASFAGSTGSGYDEAAGCSGIWAPDGSAVARAGREVGGLARGTLKEGQG